MLTDKTAYHIQGMQEPVTAQLCKSIQQTCKEIWFKFSDCNCRQNITNIAKATASLAQLVCDYVSCQYSGVIF